MSLYSKILVARVLVSPWQAFGHLYAGLFAFISCLLLRYSVSVVSSSFAAYVCMACIWPYLLRAQALCSTRTVFELADGLETLTRDFESIFDDRVWHGEAWFVRSGSAVDLLRVAVGCSLAVRAGAASGHGVGAHIVEDAAQERGEGGDLAGTQEGEGVVLDQGGPVGGVGVQGVEERFLDPVKPDLLEQKKNRVAWTPAYLETWPSRRSKVLICDRRSGSRVAGV